MKKIMSRQVPRAAVTRSFLASGLLLGMVAVPTADATDTFDPRKSPTFPAQVAISGDQGCVVGAYDMKPKPSPPKTCRQVGSVVTCN